MKTVNANSVLGVMNLFNNEEYYMKAIHALWVLRALVVKDVEYTDTNGCLRYDEKSPKYWLYRLTNELIGRRYVDGYIFLLMQGRPNWNNWNRRTGDNGFLTYNEARTIANIAKKEEMIGALIKLREFTAFAANDKNNPSYVIYDLANGLINAFGANKLLCA